MERKIKLVKTKIKKIKDKDKIEFISERVNLLTELPSTLKPT
jgi:Cu/Ag efflux protein CusF